MNHIIVTGRMTKDPALRTTPTGKNVVSYTLAVDRPFLNSEGKRDADFINVVEWDKFATHISNNCHKGSRVLVEGRLQIRNFDGKDGTKHWVAEIVAMKHELLDKKERTEEKPQEELEPSDVSWDELLDHVDNMPDEPEKN